VALVPALLLKESAAVLPLQIALLWLAAPNLRDRQRSIALLTCFALIGLFFAWHTLVIDAPLTVYDRFANSGELFWLAKFFSDLASPARWLKGLMGEYSIAAICLFSQQCLLLVSGIGWRWLRGESLWLPLAVSCAAGGLVLATIFNLGRLAATGEGGRLLYSPLAWFFVASGVAPGTLRNTIAAHPARLVAAGMMMLPVLLGMWLLFELVLRAHSPPCAIWLKPFPRSSNARPGTAEAY
jgi:hypothetical protein